LGGGRCSPTCVNIFAGGGVSLEHFPEAQSKIGEEPANNH
jgi:hypothetical protein